MTTLAREACLEVVSTAFYKLDVPLERLLGASFPEPGAADEIRRTFADDIGHDRLGVGARRVDGQIWFAFPVVILVGRKPG